MSTIATYNGYVKVTLSSAKENLLQFHDGQRQFKVPLMLYADFESILKPANEQYGEKMNQMKTGRKCKSPYAKKSKANKPTRCSVKSTFAMKLHSRVTAIKAV